jgi:hypothetical protein
MSKRSRPSTLRLIEKSGVILGQGQHFLNRLRAGGVGSRPLADGCEVVKSGRQGSTEALPAIRALVPAQQPRWVQRWRAS